MYSSLSLAYILPSRGGQQWQNPKQTRRQDLQASICLACDWPAGTTTFNINLHHYPHHHLLDRSSPGRTHPRHNGTLKPSFLAQEDEVMVVSGWQGIRTRDGLGEKRMRKTLGKKRCDEIDSTFWEISEIADSCVGGIGSNNLPRTGL